MAWAKVAMPPMAVPTRIPHRILSTLSICSLSMAMFAASSACSKSRTCIEVPQRGRGGGGEGWGAWVGAVKVSRQVSKNCSNEQCILPLAQGRDVLHVTSNVFRGHRLRAVSSTG